MKIAFNASAILGRSGIERYSRELIKGLLRIPEIDEVRLIVNDDDGGRVAEYIQSSAHARVIPSLPQEARYGKPLRRVMRFFRRAALTRSVRSAEIVHLLEPGKIIPATSPIVTTVHDLFPMMPEMGIRGQLARRFPKRVKKHLDASQAIMCPSVYVAGTIRDAFPWYTRPIHVTPLAAGDEFVPTMLSAEVRERYAISKPYIIFIGRIDPRKNIERMMAAWRMLPRALRQHAEFLVLVAGGDDAVEKFQRQYASAAEASIRVLHNVSTKEMIQLLSSARALAFATLGEGFGLPVLEAMRCGCPVITSDTTSLPEVAGTAALYVHPLSEEEIASAMVRCLEDDDLVESLRVSGIARSASFTWDHTARATFEVYRSVVG